MEDIKATIIGAYKDLRTRKVQIQLETERDIREALAQLVDKPLRVKICQWREKRSLDANSYYWKLLTELSEKLQCSKPYLHNMMLRQYGQDEMIDGQLIRLVLPEGPEAERKAEEAESYHIRPTTEIRTGADGRLYRTYIMMRGSSTYDTREMSRLIDGLVEECKAQGIETLPPDEFGRMMERYGEEVKKRTNA